MKARYWLFPLVSILLFTTCERTTDVGESSGDRSSCLPNTCKLPVSLLRIEYDELPFTRDRIMSFNFEYADSNGIRLVEYNGTPEYNPVTTALDALCALETYHFHGGQEYLDYAILAGNTFIARAHASSGALFFPYEFSYQLHRYSGDWMIEPWFSGMAQGLWLSVFAWLHHFTGDLHWFNIGEQVLASFLMIDGVLPTCFVSDEYYWIDEYPMDTLDTKTWTLNGMMYAMYGLYDWWWEFDSACAEDILCCALATMKKDIMKYRVEQDISFYCLRHKSQIGKYHMIHIEQLEYMCAYSGDVFFQQTADLFTQDYQE